MNILFDIGHPAHVHLFRNSIHELINRGHCVVVTARVKDVTTQLLDLYGISYTALSKAKGGWANLMLELVEQDVGVYKIAKAHRCDLLVGTSVAVAHASRFLAGKSVVLNEDSRDANPLFARLAYPFADYIVTPESIVEDYGEKHIKYKGNHELAYLHPNWFKPNPKALEVLELNQGERFFVLRFVSLKASHDSGQKGISNQTKNALVRILSQYGKVLITSEGPLPKELEAYRSLVPIDQMHNVLAYASLFVGDSQTMAAEAAVLGIPAIRCNTFVGRIPYLDELENVYGLAYGYQPSAEREMLKKVKQLASENNIRQIWQEKRMRMLDDSIDVTAWLVKFLESLA